MSESLQIQRELYDLISRPNTSLSHACRFVIWTLEQCLSNGRGTSCHSACSCRLSRLQGCQQSRGLWAGLLAAECSGCGQSLRATGVRRM